MFVRNILLFFGILTLVAGLSLAAFWYVQRHGVQVTEATEVKAPQVVQPAILVATRAIGTGALLRAEDMAWRDVGPAGVAAGGILQGQVAESEFLGAVTRRDFGQGDPLVASDLVKPGDRGFLAAVLRPGTRAVSITVDASQSSSGLILPGDRIDVILIQSFGDAVAPSRKEVAETVLVDVRAIAVDQSLNPAVKAAPHVGALELQLPKTVTLEVSPRQAETVLVASQLGRLGVSVRALEGSGIPVAASAIGPTWASDVSPALKQLDKQAPSTTGSGIEKSIRTVPRRGAIIVAPAPAGALTGVAAVAPEASVPARAEGGSK